MSLLNYLQFQEIDASADDIPKQHRQQDDILLDEPFDNVDEARRGRLIEILKNLDSDVIVITHELDLLAKLEGWSLYFMLDGKLWGKFDSNQLERLYITRGVDVDAIKVMDTRLGKVSVTLDHGDIAVKMASNANTLMGA